MPQALSPARWLDLLEQRLNTQADAVDEFERYYNGEHRRTYTTEKFREAFGHLFGPFSDNWMQIVVDAAIERLKVVGFRFGSNDVSDKEAEEVWQANNLDAESVVVHTEAVKCGSAYALVDPRTRTDADTATITGEHPSEVVVACAPANRRERLAGLKKWHDDIDGYAYANLFLPGDVYKFKSQRSYKQRPPRGQRISWSEGRRESNPLGVVPVIPFFNNPGMGQGGRSDLLNGMPLQDAIDKTVQDMLLTSEFQAFPQRVLTGIEVPKDPVTGQTLSQHEIKSAQSRLWTFKDDTVKVHELSAADLSPYKDVIEMLVNHLAAQTRTPPHYLLGSIVNASGDALKAAEAGLVSRVERKILDFSDPWEEVMRLATDKRDETDAETMWADPEKKTDAERVDAAMKLVAIGVPRKIALRRAGFTAKEIERMQISDDAPPPSQNPEGSEEAANGGSVVPPTT